MNSKHQLYRCSKFTVISLVSKQTALFTLIKGLLRSLIHKTKVLMSLVLQQQRFTCLRARQTTTKNHSYFFASLVKRSRMVYYLTQPFFSKTNFVAPDMTYRHSLAELFLSLPENRIMHRPTVPRRQRRHHFNNSPFCISGEMCAKNRISYRLR